MKDTKIQDLKIGQKVKIDRGIGEIVSLNDPDYMSWAVAELFV